MRAGPAIALALLAQSFAPALAAPKSIAGCESIAAADAYNACLAEFGPASRGGGARRAGPPRAGRAAPHRAPRVHPAARRNGVTIERKGQRLRAIIDMQRR